MTREEFIVKVLNTRKKIMRINKSKKNYLVCCKIVSNLESQIKAYKKHWDDIGWKKFLERNYDDIVFLIPGNKSRQYYIETLNSLLL